MFSKIFIQNVPVLQPLFKHFILAWKKEADVSEHFFVFDSERKKNIWHNNITSSYLNSLEKGIFIRLAKMCYIHSNKKHLIKCLTESCIWNKIIKTQFANPAWTILSINYNTLNIIELKPK
jgi:hypothetical protein